MSRRALDKTLTRRNAALALFAAPGRLLYVLEPNGALDRVIDPEDVEATETLAEGFDAESGGSSLSQPLTSDGDGKFPDAWFDDATSYDLYCPADLTRPITRWNAASGTSDDTIVGIPVPELTEDEDGFTWVYDHGTGAMVWVELPSGGAAPIEVYTVIDADLFNESSPFEGWATNDTVKFTKQGNTVHVTGSVQWTGANVGYAFSRTSLLRASEIPTNMRPAVSQHFLLGTGTGDVSQEVIWAMFIFTNGSISLGSLHVNTPGAPWGDLADGETPFVSLNFAYAVSVTAT